ncbi:MAG: ribosome modulation factor [Pseudomonadales bacterium]|nr:ribosome modulation factor [Pseudomonadales bacterium]MBO6563941.1 ribosome modulation factor [Pseudomonadales bacterium]MBO6595946.1 ribosome modulation factor [Pseudomonadales bacterium]MBO6656812.1 ribosome modulation factor [Pseudomonadales bacterium]MBO6702551.1 ribosome modulation factor [Pseudomonadales bacterium]
MRRQKRQKAHRAFARGYHCGLHGKSRDMCPFHDEASKQAWIAGWRTGREDNWDGFVGTAGVNREAHLSSL